MNKSSVSLLQIILSGFDLLALNLMFFVVHGFFDRIPEALNTSYFKFSMLLNLSWFLVSWVFGLYNDKSISSFEIYSRNSARIFLGWVSLVAVYLFFFHEFHLSRAFILTFLTSFGMLLIAGRFLYLPILNSLRNSKQLSKNVLILGYNNISKKIVEYLEADPIGVKIIGFCEESSKVTELTHYPVLSELESALRVSKTMNVDEIYSTISPEQDARIYLLMRQADQECIHFKIIPDLGLFINHPVALSYIKDLPVLATRREPLEEYGNRVKKRLFDIIVSLLVILFILSWLIPLLGLVIVLESPGPVFFSQYRTGWRNKPFKCLKFRSMRVNKDSDSLQASKNDKRLTAVGKFIRKTSLDEFPQFINVLKGDMSIVGPRPHMVKQTEDYSKLINEYMVRQFLKPGITGWAQISGYRGETNTVDKMIKRIEHDLWYMENWNFWLDIKIVFLTVWNEIRGEDNAY